MAQGIKKGSRIGSYEVKKILRRDAVFFWVAAAERGKPDQVVLQVLTRDAGLSNDVVAAIKEHLQEVVSKLANFKKVKRLLIPDRISSDPEYPLFAVYRACPQDTLVDRVGKDYSAACGYWEEAAESIRVVHNRRFVHGHLTPESFVVADDEKVYLANFGYAPFLDAGQRNAMREIGDFLAPELSQPHNLAKEADIYAFAKTLAKWEPRVTSADWYKQATERDPSKRFNGIAQMLPEIERTLTAFVGAEASLDAETSTGDDAETRTAGSTSRARAVARWLQLKAEVEPSNAGEVERTPEGEEKSGQPGWYRRAAGRDPEVKLEAHARPGWHFDRWSGAPSRNDNPQTVVVDEDGMTVTAHFKKVPHVLLKAKIQPRGRGSIDGGRPYEPGETARVFAYPDDGWVFDHWTGALSGSENPAELTMTAAATVTAHFVRVGGEEGGGRVVTAVGSPWVMFPLCGGCTVAVGLWASAMVDLRVAATTAAGSALLAVGVFLTRLILGGSEE